PRIGRAALRDPVRNGGASPLSVSPSEETSQFPGPQPAFRPRFVARNRAQGSAASRRGIAQRRGKISIAAVFAPWPACWLEQPVPGPRRWRANCSRRGSVTQQKQKIIAVRHLRAGGRLIPVHFSRNAGGSVAGRAVLGVQDTPIVDGPDPEAVLAVLRDVIDGLLLARQSA